MPLPNGSSSEPILSNNAVKLSGRRHMHAADAASKREYDVNGWCEVKDNPLSKVGVFPYLGRSIDPSFEPDKVYMVYRPEEELSNPETIDSFRLLPWVDDHPNRLLGPDDAGRVPAEKKGIEGVIGEEIYFKAGVLYGNIKVLSENLADTIASGKRELSVGYGCRYELSSGIYNGQKYDAIQRNIRGNHLATVAEGRMGPDVAVLDQLTFTFDAKDLHMADTENGTGEQNAAATLDQVLSALKTLGESHASVKGMIDKHFAADKGDAMNKQGCDETEEEKKKKEEKEASDKAAKDAEEKEDKEKKDKEASDKAAQDAKGTMDAVAELRADVEKWKKEGVTAVRREMKQATDLASKLSGFVGVFDSSEMTLAQVAEYGVKKLGLNCAKGHEQTALEAFLHNRPAPGTEPAFAFDGKQGSGDKQSVAKFFSTAA